MVMAREGRWMVRPVTTCRSRPFHSCLLKRQQRMTAYISFPKLQAQIHRWLTTSGEVAFALESGSHRGSLQTVYSSSCGTHLNPKITSFISFTLSSFHQEVVCKHLGLMYALLKRKNDTPLPNPDLLPLGYRQPRD
jgi:hypothetical protein